MEDFSVLDSALGLAQLIGPVVVGLLTVPVLGGIKKLASFIDRLPAAVQQILAVLIASGLTWVGTTMSMVLPEGFALFTGHEVEGLLAGVLALAIHAGQKAKAAG